MRYALELCVASHTANPVHAIGGVKKVVSQLSRTSRHGYLPLGIILRQLVNILACHAFYSMQRNKQHTEISKA
jgi:hypothetical protein